MIYISSTNRSDARSTHISDYYVTPINKIEEFLREFSKHESIFYDNDIKILDPCAGGDQLHPMSYPQAIRNVGVEAQIDTIDIRQDSLADIKTNYLTYNIQENYQIIITNPPFNIARGIIEKAINDVENNGFVIMLLRLNFLEGKLRKDLWEKYMPKYIFVHHRRMSFTDKGGMDSIAYAHFVWQKKYEPEFSKIKVI